jgi:protein-S-isoprenylcysteine O-methyltransferase Ste14
MDRFSFGLIAVCFGIFFVYWTVAAFTAKRTVERQSRWQRALLIAVFFATFMLLRRGGVFSALRNDDRVLWLRTPEIDVIADLAVVSGLGLMLWARTILGDNWSYEVAFMENHELIERGPYSYVRHPIYTGFILMASGVAIYHGHLGGFVAVLILFLGFWFKSLQEERLLTKHFPEAHRDYKTRVRALIPFVF